MQDSVKQTQRDECYKSLRRMLLHGLIAPGKRLTETVWAKQLGVTRGALREAMSMLLHEGLITRGERGGFFVPELGPVDYEEVLEVRYAIEAGAMRLLAMKKLTPANLSRMRETCDAMERMDQEDYDLGLVEADRRFHELLVEAGRNVRLQRVYSRAPLPLIPSMDPSSEMRHANHQRTIREHRLICDLLEQGNVSEACKVLEKHLFASSSPA